MALGIILILLFYMYPMIAAIWGVFIWKEFKGSDKKTDMLLGVMFLFFIAGLGLIILSGGN